MQRRAAVSTALTGAGFSAVRQRVRVRSRPRSRHKGGGGGWWWRGITGVFFLTLFLSLQNENTPALTRKRHWADGREKQPTRNVGRRGGGGGWMRVADQDGGRGRGCRGWVVERGGRGEPEAADVADGGAVVATATEDWARCRWCNVVSTPARAAARTSLQCAPGLASEKRGGVWRPAGPVTDGRPRLGPTPSVALSLSPLPRSTTPSGYPSDRPTERPTRLVSINR